MKHWLGLRSSGDEFVAPQPSEELTEALLGNAKEPEGVENIRTWLPLAEKKIVSKLDLKDNWDGHGAKKPTVIAATAILRELVALDPDSSSPDSIYPTVEGGFGVEWDIEGTNGVTITVSPSGRTKILILNEALSPTLRP